jgi:hypothetical protein
MSIKGRALTSGGSSLRRVLPKNFGAPPAWTSVLYPQQSRTVRLGTVHVSASRWVCVESPPRLSADASRLIACRGFGTLAGRTMREPDRFHVDVYD